MSTSATLLGQSYTIPTTGDTGWGTDLTAYLVAIATSMLQKSGGSFTLTADVDFGATYGLKTAYYTTKTTNPSTAGVLRLARADVIGWRNQANGANLSLGVDSSNNLTWESVPVVTTTGTQTLTGKTLTSPTLTSPTMTTPTLGVATATSVNKVVINAPSSAAVLSLADGSTLATSGAYSITLFATAATNVYLPTSGTLATRAGTETLSGKTLLTPIIDDYAELNEESAPSSPAAGKVRLYAKTDKKLYTKDSDGTETQVGAGGSGELNLIDNPSDANNWTETGTRFNSNPTTTTTSGDLPLEGTVSTAIQIVSSTTVAGDETTDYVSYPFTTGAAMGQKMKVEFYMRPGSNFVASEWTVSVWDTAGPTRQALSTDSSSLTYLPNATGKFTTTFDAVASTSYTLRFTRRVAGAASAATLNLANVIVGPGIQPQGAVVGATNTVTFTGSWSSNTTYTAKETRIGGWAEYAVRIDLAGAPTSAPLTLTLPTGRTIDTTQLPAITNSSIMPDSAVSIRDSGTATYIGEVQYNTTTTVAIMYTDDAAGGVVNAAVTQAAPMTFASGDSIMICFRAPIAEWAGSGTVNVAQNDVEYAYNTSATTANDASSFGYGPAGALIQNFAPAATGSVYKRVNFQTPIQSTDALFLEVNDGNSWALMSDRIAGFATNDAGTAYYGTKLIPVNSTDVSVYFFSKAEAVDAWSVFNTYKWRVKKVSGGQAVGFGKASTASLGLVTSYAPVTRSSVYTASGDYTVLDGDGYETIIGSHTANQTITLPAAANNSGRRLAIKKSASGGVLTVDGNASETIDGYTTVTLSLLNDSIVLVCNGSNWFYEGAHYQSFADTTTVPTAAGTSPSTNGVYAVRVGNVVTVRAAATTGTGSPGNTITWTGLLPAWARPGSTVDNVSSLSTGSEYLYLTEITSAGTVYIARIDDTTALTAANFATSAGTGAQTISYIFGV